MQLLNSQESLNPSDLDLKVRDQLFSHFHIYKIGVSVAVAVVATSNFLFFL